MLFRMNHNHPSAPSGALAIGQATVRHWGRILVCCVVIAVFAAVVGPGQLMNNGKPNPSVMPDNQPNVLPDVNQQMMMHQQQASKRNFEAVNAERRRAIVGESALLLKLATDLKAEVDKSNKDTLSLNVIRRADLVERLAHDMKEKMKLSIAAN